MQNTPRANRTHIAIFGKRNSGKSSLINALTGQDIALVSSVLGTTTDPVFKSMEILPIGPTVVIDTAGLDDEGELGTLRVKKTIQVLNKTDIAIIVIDALVGFTEFDEGILRKVESKGIPAIIAVNKVDLANITIKHDKYPVVNVSSTLLAGFEELKKVLGEVANVSADKTILGDLIKPHDIVLLVTPIDSAAPKGRMILPQQQVVRDILENDAIVVACKEFELEATLKKLEGKIDLVITDSQAFELVNKLVPKDIPLTSFSILFARYKGDLNELVRGAKVISKLKDGAKILIAEGCTHHKQKDDIGTVKIPKWLRKYTGLELEFEHYAGHGYPEGLDKYDLIIHCGACMLNEKEVLHRIEVAVDEKTPIVNYGVLIAYLHGIFDRALTVFPEVLKIYES